MGTATSTRFSLTPYLQPITSSNNNDGGNNNKHSINFNVNWSLIVHNMNNGIINIQYTVLFSSYYLGSVLVHNFYYNFMW